MPDVDHPRSTASKSLPDKLFGQAIDMVLPLVFLGVIFVIFAGRSVGASLMASFVPLFKMAGVMLGFAIVFVVASAVARRYTAHRGATHSLFAAGVATLCAMLVALATMAALSSGSWGVGTGLYAILLGLGLCAVGGLLGLAGAK